MSVEWKVSTTASIATPGAQAWFAGAGYGTEFVHSVEPTSDTTQSFAVAGLTRADDRRRGSGDWRVSLWTAGRRVRHA